MAERLHVGLVVGPTTGGIGRHIETVAAGLVARGHEVTVCGPAATAGRFGWEAAGATVVSAPVGSTRPLELRDAAHTVRTQARTWDITHAHGVRAGVTAAAAAVEPLLATWHNGPHDRWRRRWVHPLLERFVCHRAGRLLVVSPDLADRARRAGAADVRVAPVIAAPLPAPTRTRADVRAELAVGDRPMVLALARLEPQKRLDVLVDAVAGRRSSPAAVFVAGTGSLESRLRRRIDRAAAPVTLLGRREDVADLLAAADIVVLTSGWEGSPLVAQEALRAGVPLIATAVGGVPSLVGAGAILVPPGHPQAVRTALDELLDDPGSRERWAAAGRARAAEWPTTEQMVDELVDNYLDLKSRMRSS